MFWDGARLLNADTLLDPVVDQENQEDHDQENQEDQADHDQEDQGFQGEEDEDDQKCDIFLYLFFKQSFFNNNTYIF